jgi:hypothetical protein
MLDPSLLNNFGWGAAGLFALWLVLKEKPWKNGAKKINGAGERSVEEWRGILKDLLHESNEELMNDMRNLMNTRNEKVREIIRDELRERKGRI